MSEENKNLAIIGIDEKGEPVVREPIFISLSSYKNSKFLDVRKFYKEGEEWLPTKKGITINQSQFKEFLAVLNKNEQEITNWLNSAE
jgi:Transcriptional Coactivator p15 (PC4)